MAAREKITLGWRRSAGEVAPAAAHQDDYVEVAECASRHVAPARVFQPIPVDPWTPPDPLDVCLECWKSWMGRSDADLGTQQQKLLCSGEEENRKDVDCESVAAAAEQRRENEIAEATDAAINSLRACDRWAIYKMCGLSSVWKFPGLDFMHAAIGAKEKLAEKLRENIATRALFG